MIIISLDKETNILQPIWISTISHMNEFNRIFKEAPIWKRIISFYKIPKGFPFVKVLYTSSPIVYFGNVRLVLEDERAILKSVIEEKAGLTYFNIVNNINFELDYSMIKSIEWYEHPKYYIKYYNIKWIRVKLNSNSFLDGDFLMCVGGYGPSMKGINRSSEYLYNRLIQVCKGNS